MAMQNSSRAPAKAAPLMTGAGQREVMPMSLGSIKKEAAIKHSNNSLLANGPLTLDSFLDVPMTLVFEVGRAEITIKQLMELNRGSLIELWQVPVDVIDIRVNDRIIAYGEAIALKQRYGIRFGELEPLLGFEAES